MHLPLPLTSTQQLSYKQLRKFRTSRIGVGPWNAVRANRGSWREEAVHGVQINACGKTLPCPALWDTLLWSPNYVIRGAFQYFRDARGRRELCYPLLDTGLDVLRDPCFWLHASLFPLNPIWVGAQHLNMRSPSVDSVERIQHLCNLTFLFFVTLSRPLGPPSLFSAPPSSPWQSPKIMQFCSYPHINFKPTSSPSPSQLIICVRYFQQYCKPSCLLTRNCL